MTYRDLAAPRPPTHPGLTPTSPPIYEEGEPLPDREPRPIDPPRDWRTVEMPPRVARLPRDRRGYPVFYTIEPPEGVPRDGRVDFAVMNVARAIRCGAGRLCGVCGKPLGETIHFLGGPMCCQNRVFGDPAMHLECATYARLVCPYLTNAVRNYDLRERPNTIGDPNVILTKPERLILYTCRRYKMQPPEQTGGKPIYICEHASSVEWYSVATGAYLCRTRPTRYSQ
jgi:hypothetical protein